MEIADKPIELSLPLHRAMDVSGTIEIARGSDNTTNQVTPNQVNLQLITENQFGGPPTVGQVNEDGTFVIKSVLPGEWRIRLFGSSAFLKSARFGADDVTNRPLDLTSGTTAPLRIVVGTDTATIRGTGPPGHMVLSEPLSEPDQFQGFHLAPVDSSGQFKLQGLAPGKYRIALGDAGSPMSEEDGKEVTVGEGETANIDLKPETKPPEDR